MHLRRPASPSFSSRPPLLIAATRSLAMALFTTLVGCASAPSGAGSPTSVRNYTPRTYTQTAKFDPIHAPAVFHDPHKVRVLILSRREAFDLRIAGPVEVLNEDFKPVETRESIPPQPVTLTGASLAIGNKIYYGSERLQIRIKSADGRVFLDDEDLGAQARLLTIYRNPGERTLQVVVSFDLEDYLYGVLAGEVPVEWPAEALKAQAVASRTYVMYAMQDRRYEEYDVERTVNSQVFKTGDAKSIDPRVLTAVDATRGEFLTSASAIFPAYFHSTSGGATANATAVFGVDDVPALRGGCEDTYGAASNLYRWTRSFPLSEFELRLQKKGLWDGSNGNHVVNIQPTGDANHTSATPAPVDATRAPSTPRAMRATNFELTGTAGRKTIEANDFRLAFGGGRNDLPSTFFSDWSVVNGTVTIHGQGWGHGVGMCQFGALGRAKQGQTYRQILAAYYPASLLQKTPPPATPATTPVKLAAAQ